jgi:hypothetical protein
VRGPWSASTIRSVGGRGIVLSSGRIIRRASRTRRTGRPLGLAQSAARRDAAAGASTMAERRGPMVSGRGGAEVGEWRDAPGESPTSAEGRKGALRPLRASPAGRRSGLCPYGS